MNINLNITNICVIISVPQDLALKIDVIFNRVKTAGRQLCWNRIIISLSHTLLCFVVCFFFFSPITPARHLEKGNHFLVAAFTKFFKHHPSSITCLKPAQLNQSLPKRLHYFASLSHCLPLTENARLPGTKWDLFIQDLPSSQPGHHRPESTRSYTPWGVHPNSAPKTWS